MSAKVSCPECGGSGVCSRCGGSGGGDSAAAQCRRCPGTGDGATGDLAYKKIFPALQAMVRRGHLNVPVIGVARAGWNLEQFKARARDSVEKHGGLDPAAFAKL